MVVSAVAVTSPPTGITDIFTSNDNYCRYLEILFMLIATLKLQWLSYLPQGFVAEYVKKGYVYCYIGNLKIFR